MVVATVFLLHLLFLPQLHCWHDGAVLLRDVQTITLYRNQYTTARRTSPVPQLQCVGGSAGCSTFVPEVVQCQNKGWDGVDVQWECKADMDNWYRFGRVEVSCEGYNSPDDPYILKGSCGLEYTLELTSEGRQNKGSSKFSDFSSGFFGGGGGGGHYQSGPSGDGSGSLVVVAIFLAIAFAVYKMFLSNPTNDHHGNGSQGPDGTGFNAPPPPGFKPDYTNDYTNYGSANPPGYGFADSYTRPDTSGFGGGVRGQGLGGGLGGPGGLGGLGQGLGRGRGGGGFWSGMGTGGLLGYLFGSQRRGPTVGPAGPTYYTTSPKPSTSSGTRTASGFGGTKRR